MPSQWNWWSIWQCINLSIEINPVALTDELHFPNRKVTKCHQSNQRPLKISSVQHLIQQGTFCHSVPNTDTFMRRLSGCYSNKDVCFQQALRELCWWPGYRRLQRRKAEAKGRMTVELAGSVSDQKRDVCKWSRFLIINMIFNPRIYLFILSNY